MSWLFSSPQPDDDPQPPSRAQNDLSFLGQTLTRQIRGVATFLAPPPSSSNAALPSSNSQPQSPSPSQALLGIRNDLAEIGGSVKTGLSGISKFASNFLQVRNEASEDDDGSVPGISDEILGFVAEISKLPNCWTEFPIPLDHDFSMSDAQREHAATVEQLIPGFADLRVTVCNSMTEEKFWMVYFLLLLPRLNEDDFELLSTPKIIEARDVLLHKLQKKNTEVDTSERLKIEDEESTEQWSEEASISSGTFVDDRKKLEHEEDISFSDVEDSENDLSSRPSGLRPAQDVRACSPNGSNDWVRLNKSSKIDGGHQRAGMSKERDSEGEESNDWLTVDEFD
ncbi:hypothetical protein M0R45_003130 [Rubus argutus]|uniref:BSD domain-containing protein n=1 Tax=Rubus argutus TaxID=59490 RepID=A0AAW1YE21_RUBAR